MPPVGWAGGLNESRGTCGKRDQNEREEIATGGGTASSVNVGGWDIEGGVTFPGKGSGESDFVTGKTSKGRELTSGSAEMGDSPPHFQQRLTGSRRGDRGHRLVQKTSLQAKGDSSKKSKKQTDRL